MWDKYEKGMHLVYVVKILKESRSRNYDFYKMKIFKKKKKKDNILWNFRKDTWFQKPLMIILYVGHEGKKFPFLWRTTFCIYADNVGNFLLLKLFYNFTLVVSKINVLRLS